MRRVARRAFGIAVIPTAGLAVALAVAPSRAALSFHVWLLVVAGITLFALVRAVNDAVPGHASVFAVDGRRGQDTAEMFPSLERLERAVSMATASGYDVHHRLRPAVREIASGLLLVRRGIDLDRQPEAARAALGDTAWRLVRADRERPQSRREPGLDEDQIALVVASLEQIQVTLDELRRLGNVVLDEVGKAVVGKRGELELVLMGLLADGHVLLEDVPGLAKTLAARSFADATGLQFARVQFTPDLLPADVTGSSIWNQRDGDFEFRAGPIFTNLLLSDEINRAPPKTQAALLEAMQERQVTVDGASHRLDRPFLVLATQNPIEYEGTYPLPEAQLDRFLLRTGFGYPSQEAETEMLARRIQRRHDDVELERVVERETLLEMQAAVENVHVADSITAYVVALVRATRESASTAVGSSPRGSLALLKLTRCRAALTGRDFATPDDVKAVAVAALAHRLVLKPEMWVQRRSGADVVREALDTVPTPPAVDATP